MLPLAAAYTGTTTQWAPHRCAMRVAEKKFQQDLTLNYPTKRLPLTNTCGSHLASSFGNTEMLDNYELSKGTKYLSIYTPSHCLGT